MKYYITLTLLLIYCLSIAQGDISLTIEVSADTILMEIAFRVKYTIKNGSVPGFQDPGLKDFQLLQGPSRSSQMSFINGAKSSEESFTYYFKPNNKGSYILPSFEAEIDGKSYTSNSPKIVVVNNPDGLHQDPNTGQVEGKPLLKRKSNKRKRFKI